MRDIPRRLATASGMIEGVTYEAKQYDISKRICGPFKRADCLYCRKLVLSAAKLGDASPETELPTNLSRRLPSLGGLPLPQILILAVERDPHIRTLGRYFLEQAGYRVEFVENGEKALEQARLLAPDVLLCEILVPGLDGLSVCRAIKADPATRHIAVLIFSILAAEDRAREAGADAFLKKPLDDTELVRSIEQLLARRTSREANDHGTY